MESEEYSVVFFTGCLMWDFYILSTDITSTGYKFSNLDCDNFVF